MNLRAASSYAPAVDALARALTYATAGLVLFVFVLLTVFVIRYREGSPASRKGRPGGSVKLESSWAIGIGVFSLVAFFWSAALFYRIYAAPPEAIDLYVLGKQWMWIFQYPGGPKEIGAIKVPVGKPVRLLLTAEDVIHSFFVPAFRAKQDAVPGRYTSLWFTATEPGEYTVLCTEFCGTSHSAMRATIQAIPAEEFERYRQGYRAGHLAGSAEGARLYREASCASCHETGGRLAPELKNLYGATRELSNGKTVTVDENYLRRALLEPSADVVKGYSPIMPTFRGQLTEAEIAALVEFLKHPPKGNT